MIPLDRCGTASLHHPFSKGPNPLESIQGRTPDVLTPPWQAVGWQSQYKCLNWKLQKAELNKDPCTWSHGSRRRHPTGSLDPSIQKSFQKLHETSQLRLAKSHALRRPKAKSGRIGPHLCQSCHEGAHSTKHQTVRSKYRGHMGSLYYKPKQCIIIGEIRQNHHTFALFDPLKVGKLMTPKIFPSYPLLSFFGPWYRQLGPCLKTVTVDSEG